MKAIRLLGSAVVVFGIAANPAACASPGYDPAYDCAQAEACWSGLTIDVDQCLDASEALYDHLSGDERDRVDGVFSACRRDHEGCAFVACACRGLEATDGVCTIARCMGETKTCADFGADECASEPGCHVTGACTGEATAVCEDIVDLTTCHANGCTWRDINATCAGHTNGCSSNTTMPTCAAEQGCSWSLACEGSWICTG